MIITIKTKEWTVKVMDAESRSEWTFQVLRGNPDWKQVKAKLRSILNSK